MLFVFFFLMIRRPPRSTLLSLHDALPICLASIHKVSRAGLLRGNTESAVATELAARLRIKSSGVRQHPRALRSEEHTSELQSRQYLVCRLLLEKKKNPQDESHYCEVDTYT